MSVRQGTATRAPDARIRKRRIVERPRLFALLDHSKARVRTLVAPAGYGKTTLAEQWVARDGRLAAWYTARSSATDVAALALGLARCATSVVEGCDERLREHLRALPAPAENVETLAEILAEDLVGWPPTAWLVVDDYHEIAREPLAEDFVEALVAVSPVRFLVAGRQRPSWVSSKSILYGDVLELNQAVLAMDNEEAAAVLVDRSASSASGLVAIAHGWPAVIGLASVSSAELETDADAVPASLYHFFAEEVFSALGDEVQQGLTTLSVAPVLDRELVSALLGDEADQVITSALDVGILVERESRLDLHPLARSFLEEKSAEIGLLPADSASRVCLAHYRAHRDWDAAFEVVTRSGWAGELEPLVRDALDELLESARLSTLDRWCDFADDAGLDAPMFSVARAEVLLRHGRHLEAIAHAESAAESSGDHVFRALAVAGRAAHLASREEQALELFRRAETTAASEGERRDALWGQLLALVELERPEANETLTALRATTRRTDARDVVRAAANGLSHQAKLGDLDLEEADSAMALLERVRDPLVVSSFQCGYSSALALSARYEESLQFARAFTRTVREFRLDFATSYARAAVSLAASGLRLWPDANTSGAEAVNAAVRARDAHAHQLSAAVRMRVLAQQGRFQEALEVELPSVRSPLPAARAGLVSARALALAASGRVSAARDVLGEARGLSKAIEPTALIVAVDAICALKEHDQDSVERVRELERVAFRRGALDLLVTAYRSTPEVLGVLLKASSDSNRLVGLLRRAGDEDLAAVVGPPISSGVDLRSTLSPREREVYELMVQRLTNREIATLLFIEESTVKVHVHHIYDKLGVRSRLALTVQATLERSGQATSAIGGPSSAEEASSA
jgi:ATP/maltotriose-dependent transcriptional regulator MalT